MTEIELKAHVTDPVGTEKTIRGFAAFEKHLHKSDTYWRMNESDNPMKVRIREEKPADGRNGNTVVTYKRKELQGDIEVNDEREFSIDDRSAFESLIGDLGFEPYIKKEKDTKCFTCRSADGHNITIELSLVAGLGWFIELEILADAPTPAETESAQDSLRETLERCGIGESAIERKYYTEMLAEADDARR